MAPDRSGHRLLCAQVEVDAVSGRARGQSVQGDGTGISARINRILATYREMKAGHLLEVEAIMLKDRQKAILAAEQAERSETKGRGWGQVFE